MRQVFRRSAIVFVAAWALVCSGQSTSTSVKDQSPVSKLAGEKAEVSKLDLVLLTARIRLLEQRMAHPEQLNESVVSMYYNKASQRVVVRSWVAPEWSAAASLETAKKELSKEATEYCVDGLLMAIAELPDGAMYVSMAGPSTPPKSFCEVDFFTWEINKKGDLGTKDVATFEDGELRLK